MLLDTWNLLLDYAKVKNLGQVVLAGEESFGSNRYLYKRTGAVPLGTHGLPAAATV